MCVGVGVCVSLYVSTCKHLHKMKITSASHYSDSSHSTKKSNCHTEESIVLSWTLTSWSQTSQLHTSKQPNGRMFARIEKTRVKWGQTTLPNSNHNSAGGYGWTVTLYTNISTCIYHSGREPAGETTTLHD